MPWQNILKRFQRNPNTYTTYPSQIPEKQYENLSPQQKKRYHLDLSYHSTNQEQLRFHRTQYARLNKGLKAFANKELYDKVKEQEREIRQNKIEEQQRMREEKIDEKNKKEMRSDYKLKPIPNVIIDYFRMYKRMGKGNPTLEDIKNEEGRLLTTEEQEGYYQYLRQFGGN